MDYTIKYRKYTSWAEQGHTRDSLCFPLTLINIVSNLVTIKLEVKLFHENPRSPPPQQKNGGVDIKQMFIPPRKSGRGADFKSTIIGSLHIETSTLA
jgi:hypothetical protein